MISPLEDLGPDDTGDALDRSEASGPDTRSKLPELAIHFDCEASMLALLIAGILMNIEDTGELEPVWRSGNGASLEKSILGCCSATLFITAAADASSTDGTVREGAGCRNDSVQVSRSKESVDVSEGMNAGAIDCETMFDSDGETGFSTAWLNSDFALKAGLHCDPPKAVLH